MKNHISFFIILVFIFGCSSITPDEVARIQVEFLNKWEASCFAPNGSCSMTTAAEEGDEENWAFYGERMNQFITLFENRYPHIFKKSQMTGSHGYIRTYIHYLLQDGNKVYLGTFDRRKQGLEPTSLTINMNSGHPMDYHKNLALCKSQTPNPNQKESKAINSSLYHLKKMKAVNKKAIAKVYSDRAWSEAEASIRLRERKAYRNAFDASMRNTIMGSTQAALSSGGYTRTSSASYKTYNTFSGSQQSVYAKLPPGYGNSPLAYKIAGVTKPVKPGVFRSGVPGANKTSESPANSQSPSKPTITCFASGRIGKSKKPLGEGGWTQNSQLIRNQPAICKIGSNKEKFYVPIYSFKTNSAESCSQTVMKHASIREAQDNWVRNNSHCYFGDHIPN